MNYFDVLLSELFTLDTSEPKLDSGEDAQRRVRDAAGPITDRVDAFARRYLAPTTYERYRDRLAHIQYNVANLPSRVITFFNIFTGRARRIVEGALACYDPDTDVVTVNRAVAADPENLQLEPALGHEKVHHATRDFLKSYFERFGERARPVVEGITELINRGLGYNSGAYQEFVYAAYQTLQRLGGNLQDALYGVLNLRINPDNVVNTFYGALEQPMQPAYVLARADRL